MTKNEKPSSQDEMLMTFIHDYARLGTENERLKQIVNRITPFGTSRLITQPDLIGQPGYLDHLKANCARQMGMGLLTAGFIAFEEIADPDRNLIELRGDLKVLRP